MWRNIPIALILLPLALSSILAILKPKSSKVLFIFINSICCALSVALLACTLISESAFAVKMGEVGAPFGNELYVSNVECVVITLFDTVMLLSMLGGLRRVDEEIHENRRSLFFTVSSLLLAAINAITLTNDLFTGYVFLEITTIAAGALIFVRSREGALFAAMRYMLMNLLGSGLFLLGLAVFYCLTGELLFPQLREASERIAAEGVYIRPLAVSLILMTLGLTIKSALYPFHSWLPNAYSGATPAASSFLSSLVSKAYIFLYVKIVLRGTGLLAFMRSGAADVLFIYACFAIIMGSIDAVREHNVRRMVSYSSVAQIGYIFLSIGLGNESGLLAAVFHILAHSSAKAMLFPAVDRLSEVSGENENFRDLRGSGHRAPLAGIAFTVGAFSITGIPLLGGFSSKLYISSAAFDAGGYRMWAALGVLAFSTLLNVVYFLRTVVTIYRKGENYPLTHDPSLRPALGISLCCFIALNLYLGVGAGSIVKLISDGLKMWN